MSSLNPDGIKTTNQEDLTATNIWPFLLPTLILLIALCTALLAVHKGDLHLWLCNRHTPWLDAIIPTYSDLVNWLPYVTIAALLFYKAGWATFLASDLLLTTIIVQPLKHWVHAPRPLTWFADTMPDTTLPLVDGVRMHHWLSFPSGHTTTFFVLFFTLSLILSSRIGKTKYLWSFLLFLMAAFGAYSRIYLSQHFALDVFAGIIIAVLCTLFLYFFYVPKVRNTRFWGWNIRFSKKQQKSALFLL